MQFKLFSSKTSPVNTLFYFLLFTFFLQTRYAFFARHQLVDYLIPFIYLSDVLIILLLLSTLIWQRSKLLKFLKSLRSGRWSFQSFSFSVFLFSTAISNFFAIHSLSAWCRWFKLLEFGLFAFWIAWYTKKIFNFQFSIFNLLSIGLTLQCFVAIGEFVLQRSLGLQILGEWRFSVLTPGIAKVVLFGREFLRPYATFPHPNVLGGILAIMAPICLYISLATTEALKGAEAQKTSASQRISQCSQRLQVYYLLVFLLFTFTLFFTFSRSAWLVYIVLMFFVLLFWFLGIRVNSQGQYYNNIYYHSRYSRTLKMVLIGVLIGVVFLTAPFVYQRVKSLQTTDVLSIERRIELTRAALSMFRDYPLLGVGLGNFIPNLENYLTVSGQGRFLQPVHNVPLLILAETGIVGFTAFFLFIVILLHSFVRKVKNKKEFCTLHFEFCTLLMWLGIFITSLFDHYFWTLQAGQLFFWLTVGLTIGYNIK